MKFALLLMIVAAVAVTQGAVVNNPTRANLNVGAIGARDRLLYRSYVYRPAIPNSYQYEDVIYRGNTTTRISAIYATEQGYTQWASAVITSGGRGWNYVNLRFTSARGYGYYYLLDIWGQ